jgi:type I restriction enzyme S subunit
VTAPEDRKGYKGRLFWADAGNLIYSKIRAKQGSLAIVPEEIGSLAVSAEYPVYEIDGRKAEPAYLALVLRSSSFLRLLEGLSHGGSTKTRIPPEEFERQRIPLPPLPAQRKIVAAWEDARKYAAETTAKIESLERDIEGRFLADLGLEAPEQAALPKAFAVWWKELERWSVMFNQVASVAVNISGGRYPVTNLGSVAAISYGIQKCPANRPDQHPRPYLRVANVQRGELDLSEIKYIDVPEDEFAGLRLEPGDLLVCEGNSAELVGRPAIWRGEIPGCVHQNHILKVRACRSSAMPEFLLEYMNRAPARNHFRARAKFTTNLASINSADLRGLSLPLPPISVQEAIMRRVAAGRAEIGTLKAAAQARIDVAKNDVEAMILGTRPVEGNELI